MERRVHKGHLIATGAAFAAVLTMTVTTPAAVNSPITLLLAGDVMLGRDVGPVAALDSEGLFADVRAVVRPADLAMANLESPLTHRSHESENPHALEADPATAGLLADAGFDLLNLANNHSGDAGAGGLLDTIAAIEGAGMEVIGAGPDEPSAQAPLMIEGGSIRVAVLAFDATGAGLPAGEAAGVALWDPQTAQPAVEAASSRADLVVVSVHGGVEYLPESDPRMVEIGELLVGWGTDLVWGHGAHVAQPITTLPGDHGRTGISATSLGNFLFDQRGDLTGRGAVLQVMADGDGIVAYRLGSTSHRDLRVHFEAWVVPSGNAALIDGEWWNLVRDSVHLPDPSTIVTEFAWGEVTAASSGSITAPGQRETVISFRQTARPHPVRDGMPEIDWTDDGGMTAHLGIYHAGDLSPIWVAGVVPSPVEAVAACDGSIAMAYSALDDPTVDATGAAVWRQFGLDAVDRLDGPGIPRCADIDGDGLTEPVVLGRGSQ